MPLTKLLKRIRTKILWAKKGLLVGGWPEGTDCGDDDLVVKGDVEADQVKLAGDPAGNDYATRKSYVDAGLEGKAPSAALEAHEETPLADAHSGDLPQARVAGLGVALGAKADDADLVAHEGAALEDAHSGDLPQARTHDEADTDTGVASLHHTIGTGATQAAAGNHTHGPGLGPQSPPNDANTLARWKLDEAAGNALDSADGGANPLTLDGTGVARRASMLGGFGCRFVGTAGTEFSGANGVESASITLALVLEPTSFAGSYQMVAAKLYSPGAYESPWISFGFVLTAPPGDGSINLHYAVGAALKTLTPTAKLQLYRPQVVVATFDDATKAVCVYFDGKEVASAVAIGSIAYGTHGPWTVGGNSAEASQPVFGSLHDVHVIGRALSASAVLAYTGQLLGW
jgi:hypothetical protein